MCGGKVGVLLVTTVLVALVAFLFHEYSPATITKLAATYPILSVLGTYFHSSKTTWDKPRTTPNNELIFSPELLKQYSGREGDKGLYLAILGKVYDVEKGRKHYGPSGSYSGFAGKDGSRAFVTGEFNEKGLIDDIEGLTTDDYLGLEHWEDFYAKDYTYVGKVIGRFYDENGSPTPYYNKAQQWLKDAKTKKDDKDLLKEIFPPCNMQWLQDQGSKFWCTKLSGGVKRDWVGVPRRIYEPGEDSPRCVCVRTTGPSSRNPSENSDRGDLDDPRLREYPDCAPDADSCSYKEFPKY